MKMLECPNCSGKLKINYATGTAVCEYCGTSFLLEENKEEVEKKRKLQEIRQLQKIGDSQECEKKFHKLLKKYPTDYKILWEYVLYLTNNLEQRFMGIILPDDILEAQECARKVAKLAPEEEAKEIVEKWTAYANKYNEYLEEVKQDNEKNVSKMSRV